MQASIETIANLKRRARVSVPAEQVDELFNTYLRESANTIRLKGFRPGKVPIAVIKQRFGEEMRHKAITEVIKRSFQQLIAQENLKPASQPFFEPKTSESSTAFEYTATFEVFPDIEEKDYSSINIIQPVAEITDDDVDRMIAIFRDNQGTWVSVDRAALDNDRVNIDYIGKTEQDEAFEGGAAKNVDLILGSGQMIPGFEEGIVGLRAGEEKIIFLTFPDKYHVEKLSGQSVQFTIKVNEVCEKRLAEIDESLFEKYGIMGDEAYFRKKVRENMHREMEAAIKNKVKQQVVDALLKLHNTLQVPQALVAQEIVRMCEQVIANQLAAGRKTKASEDEMKSLLPDELFVEQATNQVKISLLINHYVSKYDLQPDASKVRTMIEEFASTYENSEKIIDFYYNDERQLQNVKLLVLEDMVIEKLKAEAKVVDKSYSYDEVLAPQQSPTAEHIG